MARSLKSGTLALLISSVTLVHSLTFNADRIIGTPTCNLVSNPSISPAQYPASWCACTAPNGDRYPGYYPTTTSSGITSPTGKQLCAYTTTPSIRITPTPVTCNLASATSGFTVPHSWCDCTASTSIGTYSTKFGFFIGINGACSFMQDEFLPAATISPSPATCQFETTYPPYTAPGGQVLPGPFYNALAWCACGDNTLYPLLPQPLDIYAESASVLPCDYINQPLSTISASPLVSTSCQLVSKQPLTTSVCECSGDHTSILYPTGTRTCVFSQVPPTPITLESLYNKPCTIPGVPFCDYDQETIVSPNSEIWIKRNNVNGSLFRSFSAMQRV